MTGQVEKKNDLRLESKKKKRKEEKVTREGGKTNTNRPWEKKWLLKNKLEKEQGVECGKPDSKGRVQNIRNRRCGDDGDQGGPMVL